MVDDWPDEHDYGAHRSADFHVSKWFEQRNKGRDLWRLKVWDLGDKGLRYRVAYAFTPKNTTTTFWRSRRGNSTMTQAIPSAGASSAPIKSYEKVVGQPETAVETSSNARCQVYTL